MSLELLSLFVAVAEAESFSVAAKRLRLPKSSVSRGVARLEDALGTQLLHRTTRRVSLSAAGSALYERTAPLLMSLREAVGVLPEPREQQPTGSLRITAPNDIGLLVLGDVVSRFSARYPAVHVEAHLTTHHVDLVAEGFDVALRASDRPLKDSSLTMRRLGSFEGHLYAAPSYLSRRGTPRNARDLESHDWVVFRHMRGPLRLEGPESIVVQPRGRIVGDDFLFVSEAARAGAGIALLDPLYTERDVAEGRLVRLLPRYRLKRGGGLYLIYPATRHVPRAVTAFRDFMLEVAAQRFVRN
ncbi:MAG TPA: LysR family transcriptional regulator [Polyangiales bacterium]|nr:LysR family transcriptional regulator [Polyangiales bacterium]